MKQDVIIQQDQNSMMENSISNHFDVEKIDDSGYKKEQIHGFKRHKSYWEKVENRVRETFSLANIDKKDIPDISFDEEAKHSPEPSFLKVKSHKNQEVQQLLQTRASMVFKSNVNNSVDMNNLRMSLPIINLLRAHKKEKYEMISSDQARVAFKLSNDSGEGDDSFKIENGKIVSDIMDYDLRSESYKIEVFEDPSTRSEEIFLKMKIEDSVYECCASGKNLTMFSVEDKS